MGIYSYFQNWVFIPIFYPENIHNFIFHKNSIFGQRHASRKSYVNSEATPGTVFISSTGAIPLGASGVLMIR